MRELHVNLGENSYDILFGSGLLKNLPEYIKRVYKGKKLFIITDNNVEKYYREQLESVLEDYDFTFYILKAGEKSKTLDNVAKIYKAMINSSLSRDDLVVAFGGGVTGDIAGFAAATYMRGVPFIQIPTTLLSQVDSSVGGKVGVDLEEGKNLVGAFNQPKIVLIDTSVLKTLTDRYFFDGLAEVVKYGCIYDENLFSLLESLKSRNEVMEHIEDILFRSCDIKREVVEEDEKEHGLRMILNFGHTVGHGLEQYYNYEKYTHGEAVSLGMAEILETGEKEGITEKGSLERVKRLLMQLNLPVEDKYNREDVIKIMKRDKKNKKGEVNFVMIEKIGKYKIVKIKENKMYDFLYENR
ncbi:MAG: 3-dehydroquinate synthase [Fusobacteriales bacterium]|jgi:3-dehydroquinate synthase|nr:3-dehydroquinate synthase [Fusobacteriales bacterium]